MLRIEFGGIFLDDSIDFGQTHLSGPFNIFLVYDNGCTANSQISPVEVQIVSPFDGQEFGDGDVALTVFEAEAWDTGVGVSNGDGINRVHFAIVDSVGTTMLNRNEGVAGYCAFSGNFPCNDMDDWGAWDTWANGTYTMWVWARSSVSGVWSEPGRS